ncbi:zinc ribbon domain-containing protein [Nonomuraea solani]|uniref:zinc ribbon domain-containing protein n=1 Tax=Nonomuraea solani TaxID=1144553 RepID=UPI000CDECDCA|nr:zinc ribbon domain-containing protein [Nonomuraea solani]
MAANRNSWPVSTRSQTCDACTHTAPGQSGEPSPFSRCVACGHRDHADVNAAKNVRDTAAERAEDVKPPHGGRPTVWS